MDSVSVGSGGADAGPLRLLLVEDEELLLMMLGDMLEDLGHRVAHTASNVDDALAVVAGHAAELDACILDANLGGERATPVAQALRGEGVPFVLVSGYDRRELDRLALTEPAIAKPYVAEDIATALAALRRAPRG